jgi:hypothetical protein
VPIEQLVHDVAPWSSYSQVPLPRLVTSLFAMARSRPNPSLIVDNKGRMPIAASICLLTVLSHRDGILITVGRRRILQYNGTYMSGNPCMRCLRIRGCYGTTRLY